MKRIAVLTIVAVMTLSAVAGANGGAIASQPAAQAPDHRFLRGTSATDIPFEMNSNHIYVTATVNGSRPLSFIFDTGAEMTVLDSAVARDLGLETAGALTAQGSGEKTADGTFAKGVSLTIGGATAVDLSVVAISLDDLTTIEGRKLDGIAGYDFLSRFLVEIDYPRQRINLFDRKSFVYKGKGEHVPFTLVQNVPRVRATVTTTAGSEFAGEFTVDTGSRSALSLNTPFVDRNPALLALANESRLAPFGFGIGGETKTRVGRVAGFRIGRFTLANVVTGFSRDAKGADSTADLAGNIGGEILRRFRVTIDYDHLDMILEPTSALSQPFEYDMFGAILVKDGGDVVIFRVVDASPASDAGLASGDAIVAIGGRATRAMTLDAVQRLFRSKPGKRLRLTIRTKTDERRVDVTLRRLV